MTSVNSPACLLARNHFYRSSGSSPEASTSVFTGQNNSVRQKQVNIWVTVQSAGLSGSGVQVGIVLDFSTFKPSGSTNQDVK